MSDAFLLAMLALFVGAMFLVGAVQLGVLNFEVCWAVTAGHLDQSSLVSCTTPGALTKQVGFGAALNWSIGLILLFPMFVYCVRETAVQSRVAIEEFVRRKMIVDKNWKPASKVAVMKLLNRRRIVLIVASMLVAVISTSIIPFDYRNVVGNFYEPGEKVDDFPLTDPELEADWSIAAPICRALDHADPRCERPQQYYLLNAVFAAGAYGYLAYFGSILAITFAFALGLFSTFFVSRDFTRAGYRLLPDLASTDPRKGFEVLEGFFLHAVAGCFVLFVMGYLVVLQNVYLRTSYSNVAELVVPFLAPVKADDLAGGLFSAVQRAVTEQLGVLNLNSVAVTGAAFLIVFVIVISAWFALRTTARGGAQVVAAGLENPAGIHPQLALHLGALSPKQARADLQQMQYWPLEWPTLNTLICWLALAILSLFFVTVGFFVMAAGLGYVIQHALLRSGAAKASKGEEGEEGA